MNAPLEWQDATREIKRRVSVREVLERAGVKLRPRHRADCPLPDCRGDRNATLHYKPRDEIWHCFRCDKGGDVFSLVEELQGCDFKRAQKYLAALARVELPAGAKMTRWERQRLAQEQAEHGRKREKVDSTSDDLEQMERRERAECCRLLHFCDDVVNLPGRWTEAQWRLAAIAHEVRRDLLCEYTLLSFAAVRQRVRYLRADELTRTGMLRAVRNAGGVTTDDGHFIEVEVMT